MLRAMTALLVALVLAAAPASAPVVAPAPAPAAEPKVGEKAPDFSLPADDGSTFTLSAAKKPVAVAFYPRVFTGGCTKQMTAFAGAKDALDERGATVVAVSVDPPDQVKKFKESLGATFPFLSDEGGSAAKRYGVYDEGRNFARRVTFVVGVDGTITHIERDKVDTEGVLAACPLKKGADAATDAKSKSKAKSKKAR